jgi:hypothetical protein
MSNYVIAFFIVLLVHILLVILIASYIGQATSSITIVTTYFFAVAIICWLIARKLSAGKVFFYLTVDGILALVFGICLVTDIFGMREEVLNQIVLMAGAPIKWHF